MVSVPKCGVVLFLSVGWGVFKCGVVSAPKCGVVSVL